MVCYDCPAHGPLAADLLPFPERQCAGAADADEGEVLQFCRQDGFHPEPPAFRPVRHRHVPGQRELAERFRGIRERGVPAPGQRGHQQRLFRLGDDRHPGRCQDHVVPLLPPGRRLLHRVLGQRCRFQPDAHLPHVCGLRCHPFRHLRLLSGGIFLHGVLLGHEGHRMHVESPRRAAAGSG